MTERDETGRRVGLAPRDPEAAAAEAEVIRQLDQDQDPGHAREAPELEAGS